MNLAQTVRYEKIDFLGEGQVNIFFYVLASCGFQSTDNNMFNMLVNLKLSFLILTFSHAKSIGIGGPTHHFLES